MEHAATYSPRPHQYFAHLATERFKVLVWHRRAGKTVAAVNELLRQVATKPGGLGCYLGPTYKQTKRVAWDLIKKYGQAYGIEPNETELRADFPNGAKIYLLAAESYDSIRGIGLDYAVLDEVAMHPRPAWEQVIRPALADKRGGALFIGTPAGRENLFHEMFQRGQRTDNWWSQLLTCEMTTALDRDELEQLQKEMPKADWDQEMLCDWSAAIRGAFYGAEIKQAEVDGRISSVPCDPILPVHTAWDIGFSDTTVVTFWQMAGAEIRCIDCKAYEQTALPDIIKDIEGLYTYGKHFGPHDLKVHEFGSGRSRLEIAGSLGFHFEIAPHQSVRDGIEAFRSLLPRLWFDADRCGRLVDALRLYRTEYDTLTEVYKLTPRHDWTSHYADSCRYFAVSAPTTGQRYGPIDYSRQRQGVV